MRRISLTLCLLCLAALSACDSLPDWLGGSPDKTPLPGKRIAVLDDAQNLHPDESLSGADTAPPELKSNENWRQAGGGPMGMTGNLQASGFTHHDSTSIGKGFGWDEPLYAIPIVADGMAFAMDAKGYVTAHDAKNIDKQLWRSKAVVDKGRPDLLGGGLAWDDGKLYVTSGRGKVAALDARTGKQLWKQAEGVPLRAPPKVAGGKVYVLTVDNQLFALSAANGALLWTHRGLSESADFLASISPAVTDAIVIAPYSSGELHALDTISGQDIWSDTLLLARRTFATAGFSGIGGNPIIHDDVVYAAGSSGFIAAFTLLNGRRIWEQNISSINTPWIAGDYLYLLASDDQIVCLSRADGRIKWVTHLQRFEDEKKRKNPYVWRGPVMVNGQLLVAGLHGQMLAISPKDGTAIATVEIPENITDAPIVAGGRVYFLTQNAKLHVLY